METENESRLSAIVQSSDDAIISKSLDGIIKSWNPAAERTFGYTPDEAIGQHISIIIPAGLREEEKEINSRVQQGEKIEHFQTKRRRKNGEELSIALTVSAIRDINDNVIGIAVIARDVSEQKKIDEKQAVLAAIIESSDDAIVSKDLNGNIISWNPGAEKIFGYTEEEVIGKHISIIIPKRLLSEETHIIGKIRKGEKVSHFETIRVRKDGREINISLTVSPVKDRHNTIIGASKIARDITEKVELEKQRKLLTKRLQELNHYKDEFMAMASHELKTPLTVIKANLQILENKMNGDTRLEFVNKTLRQVNKLSDLISDLLDVSKIQAGKLEMNKTIFDIIPSLREVIENIQQTSPDHQISLTAPSGSLMAMADKDRIEQVIINLLTNAVKYSPNASNVNVEVLEKDEMIMVKVSDYGIGISTEDLDRIFTRFFRVRGLASTFSGSGIGLYISSEIVNKHGGKIWVESVEGKGSVFYFTIPKATG